MAKITKDKTKINKKDWIDKIPHPLVILFFIIIAAAALTYILPAGAYDTVKLDGTERVVPGTFKYIKQTPVGIMDIFKSIPSGFKGIADVVFIVFASAGMFGVFEKTKTLENSVGTFVKILGIKKRYVIVVAVTYFYGLLGILVGYENNIALAPIAVLISLAIGGDLMLGAAMAVGGISVGFGLAPFNPYTVGVGHKIAGMPMFSGAVFRSILVFVALTLLAIYNVRYFKKILKNKGKSLSKGLDTSGLKLSKDIKDYYMTKTDKMILIVFIVGLGIMLYGVFTKDWYINEISAIFLMITIVSGIIARMSMNEIAEVVSKAFETCALAAVLIGAAQGIKVVMDAGHISDTIAHSFVVILKSLPPQLSAIFMTIAQSIINIFIPGGSGQAAVTLPIMLPVGDMVGITRQTTILAFQVGDGLTNIVTPTLGGLIAMLELCRIPYGRWVKFILPFVGIVFAVAWIAVSIGVMIHWGPM